MYSRMHFEGCGLLCWRVFKLCLLDFHFCDVTAFCRPINTSKSFSFPLFSSFPLLHLPQVFLISPDLPPIPLHPLCLLLWGDVVDPCSGGLVSPGVICLSEQGPRLQRKEPGKSEFPPSSPPSSHPLFSVCTCFAPIPLIIFTGL